MTIESDLRAAFNRHMDNACRLYPSVASWRNEVRFMLVPNMGKTAGKAYIDMRIEVNLTMARQNMEYICDGTIPHEIAHIICFRYGWDRGHGRNWKRVAMSLGCSGDRCFSFEETGIKPVMMRQRTKYLHKATCGTEIWLSDVMHGKIMKGGIRVLNRTGGKLKPSTFMGQVK